MAVEMSQLDGWNKDALIRRALEIGVRGRSGDEGRKFEEAKKNNFAEWDVAYLKKFIVRNEL